MGHPEEPFRIKSVEPIKMPSRERRQQALEEAGLNVFGLNSDDIYLDLLTDSGTSAMSSQQWAALMLGDETYAGAKSFKRLKKAIEDIFGFAFILPTHQGRGAESILAELMVQPGEYIPNNTHFDTTEGNIRARGGLPENLVVDSAADPGNRDPFKGNLDPDKLEQFIDRVGVENIPFGMITVTNNASGGQPVSLANIRQISQIYRKHRIPFVIDACRYAENAYFIKLREPGFEDAPIREIVREMFSVADGATMSGKKDALVNIGGFLALRDEALYERAKQILILREGFPTYGGMAGRDLEAFAVGLNEGLEEDYLAYRVQQTAYFAAELQRVGVPIMEPPGGHAVYIDAGQLLPHIPREAFPGQALVVELYLEGAIRAVDLGSSAFSYQDPITGQTHYPPLELVRLALPRRVYTQTQLDYVVGVMAEIVERAESLQGVERTWAPELMQHFTARYELA